MMDGWGDPRFKTLISVQATYPIYITPAGVLTCDDVIKVPLAYAVDRQTDIDHGSYRIIPVVELAIPLEYLVFEIITNEGVTVEPFSTFKLPDEANPYNMVRSYFVLPSGTTGIKGVVFKPKYASARVALQFGVLPPPYNYDTALFGVITSRALELKRRVENLEDRAPHYGYSTPNGEHTVDFSSESTLFDIKSDTRLITFTLNNTASTDVNFNCYIVKIADDSKKSEVTLTLKPGRSVVKIDLLTHMVYVRPSTPALLVTETYSTSGIVDIVYDTIRFGYISNDKITGVLTVYEWK